MNLDDFDIYRLREAAQEAQKSKRKVWVDGGDLMEIIDRLRRAEQAVSKYRFWADIAKSSVGEK